MSWLEFGVTDFGLGKISEDIKKTRLVKFLGEKCGWDNFTHPDK